MKAKYFTVKKTSYKDSEGFSPEGAGKSAAEKPDPGTDLIVVQAVGSGVYATYHTGIDVHNLIVPQNGDDLSGPR